MERLPLAVQLSPEIKIEEDDLVMDGILVESVKHGASRLRSSSTSSDSGGSYSSDFPSPGSFYKTQMCRAWEILGACQLLSLAPSVSLHMEKKSCALFVCPTKA